MSSCTDVLLPLTWECCVNLPITTSVNVSSSYSHKHFPSITASAFVPALWAGAANQAHSQRLSAKAYLDLGSFSGTKYDHRNERRSQAMLWRWCTVLLRNLHATCQCTTIPQPTLRTSQRSLLAWSVASYWGPFSTTIFFTPEYHSL